LLLAAGLLISGSAPAEAATTRPTSVTLSPTADPAHSQTFTWRMTKKRSGEVVQIKAPDGKVTTAAARYKMRVQKKYSGTNAYAFTATATPSNHQARGRHPVRAPDRHLRWFGGVDHLQHRACRAGPAVDVLGLR